MKTTKLWFLSLVLALACVWAGCTTVDPATGQKKFDVLKTEQVKAAIDPLISGAARRVVANSPQHSDEIASYFRNVGTVLCKMRDSGQFTPDYLIAEADKATAELQSKVDPYVIDIKNAGIALYKIFYAEKARADLPPDKFMWNVSDLFCKSIDQALKDAGKPGVR